jgi:hypothetical protein
VSSEALQSGLWPYLLVIAFGFLPSEVWRVLAVFLALGIAAFFLARRSVMAGVVAGEAALVAATWWIAGALP